MGMPEIPSGKNRPTIEETVIDLLESIALEEMAISHILNAEGEKLQHVVQKYHVGDIYLSDLGKVSKNLNTTLVDLIMKEWLLLNKLNRVEELSERYAVEFPKCKTPKNNKFQPCCDKFTPMTPQNECYSSCYQYQCCRECREYRKCNDRKSQYYDKE